MNSLSCQLNSCQTTLSVTVWGHGLKESIASLDPNPTCAPGETLPHSWLADGGGRGPTVNPYRWRVGVVDDGLSKLGGDKV